MNKILIVDDDGGVRDGLSALLGERYDVVLASNGREAIDRLEGNGIDLIVLDLVMPRLDGEGALREIRGRGLRMPVIVVSTTGDRLAAAEALGADGHLRKPFDIAALEAKIDRLLASPK